MARFQKWTREELKEEIESWETQKLKEMYMFHFITATKHPDPQSQLELISKVLSERDFNERLEIYHQIRRSLDVCVKKEDYENASTIKQMLEYYYRHVLD